MTDALLCFWSPTIDWVCSQNATSNATKPITSRMIPGAEKFIIKQAIPKTRNTIPMPPQINGIFDICGASCSDFYCTIVVCVFFLAISSVMRRLSFCLSRISTSVGRPNAKVRFNTASCSSSLSDRAYATRLWLNTSRSRRAC